MKSFIAYPIEFETLLYPNILKHLSADKTDQSQLFRQLQRLEGIIVKCGITMEEGFSKLEYYKTLISDRSNHKMVAFEKLCNETELLLAQEEDEQQTAIKKRSIPKKLKPGNKELLEFIPGDVSQSIPEYLIENPEIKIALLSIDMNDYEGTMTALEFFYPRLVRDGVLILENYALDGVEKNAVHDYFAPAKMMIHFLAGEKGPHFIVRE